MVSIVVDHRGKIHLSSSSDPLWIFEEDLLVIQDGKVVESNKTYLRGIFNKIASLQK